VCNTRPDYAWILSKLIESLLLACHCREVPRKDDTTATFSLRLERPKIRFVSCMEFSKKAARGEARRAQRIAQQPAAQQ
jgi:hypothetical protein